MKIKILSSFVLLLLTFIVNAQDNHFSSISNTTLVLNPACAGVFNQDARLSMIYRTQGSTKGFTGKDARPYTNAGVQSDFALFYNKKKSDFFGFGVNAFQHTLGFMGYKQTSASLSLSYTKSLTSDINNFFSIGFQGGLYQRAISFNLLTWDESFDGTFHNGPSTEYYDTKNKDFYDFGTGILYNTKLSNMVRLNFGGSLFHMFEPKVSMNAKYIGADENIYKVNKKYTLHGIAEIYTANNSQTIIVPSFIYSVQNAQKNTIFSVDLKYLIGSESISTDYIRQNSISFGLAYRNHDALIPHIKMDYKQLSYYIAYDFTVSKLRKVNNSFGALEIGFTWRLNTRLSANNKPRVYKFIQ